MQKLFLGGSSLKFTRSNPIFHFCKHDPEERQMSVRLKLKADIKVKNAALINRLLNLKLVHNEIFFVVFTFRSPELLMEIKISQREECFRWFFALFLFSLVCFFFIFQVLQITYFKFFYYGNYHVIYHV